MSLPELSIKRHVFAFMLNAVLVLFGIIAYQKIGVDRMPYVEFPVISIVTTQSGANPEILDASITNIVETAVNSIPGIEHIQSTSTPGVSIVTITFSLEKNVDVAFNEVQSKVSVAAKRLPDEADQPVVSKVETNASPIMWLALSGDRTLQQLNEYGLNVLKKKLETIDGVGEVRLGGRRDRTIRLNLNPAKMASLGVTANDLVDALHREHVQLPGGFLVGQRTEYMVRLDMEFHKLDELKEMVLLYRNGMAVRLKDIANVIDDLSDYRQFARFNGDPTVGVGIVKVSNSNTVAISEAIKAKLEKEIIPQLPAGMKIREATNDAVFVIEMIDALKDHLLEGTLLAGLIVWIFLRSVRSTIIISLAIPVSLLGAVAVMYFLGFTFNTLTLLALLLLIGVVVDDAIVVLENIYRHREENNSDAVTASIEGSREVVFAVLAATLSLVAIFAPVIFMQGIIGRFFKSFAVVVTFGVLVSLFVSLTLTPMLCSKFLTVNEKHGFIYRIFDKIFDGMDRIYIKMLSYSLNHRWKIVFLTLIIVASSGFFFKEIKKEFSPEQDESRFMINVKAPLGSSINYTKDKLIEVENVVKKYPFIRSMFTAVGSGQRGQVNEGFVYVRLLPKEQREISQQDFLKKLRKELSGVAGIKAFPAPIPMISGGGRGDPLQFVLTGQNLGEVSRIAQELQKALQSEKGIGRVDTDLQLDLPQLFLKVDRVKSASFGVSSNDVATVYNYLVAGNDIARFNEIPGDGNRYNIRLKAEDNTFKQPSDLKNLYIRNKTGDLIRLDNLMTLEQRTGPAVIGRYDLLYSATFYATPTIALGDALDIVKEKADKIVPTGYQIKPIGESEQFGKTAGYMAFAFGLALILLYMVLASQFNSFIQPLVIMLAQPLAIVGGVFALWISGSTINIYSMIGLILLIGLVAKNSILLVDLTNQLREKGVAIDDALNKACPIRLRPVVMTSMTLILAMLPASLGIGAGAETNQPLSIAVIGGMISSTLLTLIIVPAVYSLVEHGLSNLKTWRNKKSLTLNKS